MWLEVDAKRRLRHAVEVRHESSIDADFVRLQRQYGVALVVATPPAAGPSRTTSAPTSST